MERPDNSAALAWALHYFMQLRVPKIEWRAVIESAHEAAKRADNRRGQANTLQALGDVGSMEGEYEPARNYYEGALGVAEQIGDFPARLNCLWNLGPPERALGNTEAACDYFRRPLVLADSHPFFRAHPVVQRWRAEYEALGCS